MKQVTNYCTKILLLFHQLIVQYTLMLENREMVINLNPTDSASLG